MSSFVVEDRGREPYADTLEFQRHVLERVIAGEKPPTLILVEHPAILTLGANFHRENLTHTEDWYKSQGIDIAPSDRGGDVTLHNPGQLVAYPIFPLELEGKDLHRWLRTLEELIIETISEFGLSGYRFPPNTGVWVEGNKICAMGIKVRKWVSMHGLALNCNNDLAPFDWIVPCGIKDFGVTSISHEAKRDVSVEDVKPVLIERFRSRFG